MALSRTRAETEVSRYKESDVPRSAYGVETPTRRDRFRIDFYAIVRKVRFFPPAQDFSPAAMALPCKIGHKRET